MSIQTEISTLSKSISDIKDEIKNKGQTVSTTDTVSSLPSKIDNISNLNGEPYSRTVLNDVIEGTVQYLYDTVLDYLRPYCFCNCEQLQKARFTKLKKICRHAFDSCYQFDTLILESNQVVILDNQNAFRRTLFEKNLGTVYVKDSLINNYKSDSQWGKYSIKGISELGE